jgi:hypothetical protein
MEQKIEDGEKCNSLAAWDMVCKPKNKGGLGVLNLKIQNHGLLLKYLHKFYNKADTPWVHLIWNTYYREHIRPTPIWFLLVEGCFQFNTHFSRDCIS